MMRRSIFPLLALLVLTACASFQVADTVALQSDQLEPPGAETISRGGYRLASFPGSPDAEDLRVTVAMSGGGKRSAAFAYGALKGLRAVMVQTPSGPRPLLSEVDFISGVSGGSFPAAYYGLYRDRMFGQFEQDFLYDDTNSYIAGIYLLPWNWSWLFSSGIGSNDYMDRVYDRTMFHGATFADLQQRGRPVISIGATDISYGTPFQFTQEAFDLICADISKLPVSRAVAASNGFPGLFSPVNLTNRAASCGGRAPAWLARIPAQERQNPLSRSGQEAARAQRYLDPRQTRYLHLSDGGVSDNLAMRSAGAMMQTATVQSVASRGLIGVRRLLMISVDGQGAQDTETAQREDVGGLLSLLGLVSGAQIDSYNFETLNTVNDQIRYAVTTIRAARCAKGRVVDGAPCDDVQGALIHISLAGMADSPDRTRLLAIPTGLSLTREDVDLLVQAGESSVVGSAALRAFLADYPIGAHPPQRKLQAQP